MANARVLTQKIKHKALELGFARVGVTTADPIEGYEDETFRPQNAMPNSSSRA